MVKSKNKLFYYLYTSFAYILIMFSNGAIIQSFLKWKKLNKATRKHIFSRKYKTPIWHRDDKGRDLCPLPNVADSKQNNPVYIRVLTGDIPKNANAFVRIGIDNDVNPLDFDIFVNSVKTEFIEIIENSQPEISQYKLYSFKIDVEKYEGPYAVVEIVVTKKASFKFDYVDVTVIPD